MPDDVWDPAQEVAAEYDETVTHVIVGALRRYARTRGWDLDPVTTIERLARLHAAGILPDDEWTAKRRELLDRI